MPLPESTPSLTQSFQSLIIRLGDLSIYTSQLKTKIPDFLSSVPPNQVEKVRQDFSAEIQVTSDNLDVPTVALYQMERYQKYCQDLKLTPLMDPRQQECFTKFQASLGKIR